MDNIKIVLIIANSARLLAQSAKKIGFLPLVVDCFSDVDTQEIALDFVKVANLSVKNVKKAISLLSEHHSVTHIIYGSGLENQQDSLNYLEKNFTVLGNSLTIFSAIQNKIYFFKKLKQLNIAFPETCFQAPENKNNWLTKPLAGEGGFGIKMNAAESKDCYWQKYCVGMPKSVLFIATGSEYKIIGFHKQFVTQLNKYPFVFAGVINQPELNDAVVLSLKQTLKKLVNKFSLKGINSLDFIENNNQCYVLEVNPRPSASLNLYDLGLLSEHIDSCLGGEAALALPEPCEVKALSPNNPSLYRAYKILFAKTDITISSQIIWPLWVSDIPQKGSIINTAMPICSIIADGKNEQQVDDLLCLRQQQLIKLLT